MVLLSKLLEISMKYDNAAKKIAKVMGEFKDKKLHSGKGGPVVKNPKQAVAIAMSEARSMPKRGQRTATNKSKK
jgi:hypothetical protein